MAKSKKQEENESKARHPAGKTYMPTISDGGKSSTETQAARPARLSEYRLRDCSMLRRSSPRPASSLHTAATQPALTSSVWNHGA